MVKNTENYMFFNNLKQIKKQCELLLGLNEKYLDKVINNGHDWADDHISVAKENIDQVFDFLMKPILSKIKENLIIESQQINEIKNCPTDPTKWAASKAAAKSKFDIYPSAYANGWAAKNYKSKGGTWKKCKN